MNFKNFSIYFPKLKNLTFENEFTRYCDFYLFDRILWPTNIDEYDQINF